MHPVITAKDWSHHLHDDMLHLWHHIDEHLHSRHFWMGVGITLLVVGLVALLFVLASNAPIAYPQGYPYIPYGV